MSGSETLISLAQGLKAVATAGQGFSDYSAGMADAKTLRRQAAISADQTAFEVSQLRQRNRQVIGTQVADAGASGLTFDGSIADVVHENAVNLEMDVLAAKYKGAMETAGFVSQAAAAEYSAKQAAYGGVAEGDTSYLMSRFAEQPAKKPYRKPLPSEVQKIPYNLPLVSVR